MRHETKQKQFQFYHHQRCLCMSPEFVSLSDCASSSRLHEIIVELQRRDWKCFSFSSHHHHLILSPFSHSSMLFTRILHSWFIQDFDRNDRVMNWNVSLEANRTCKLTWKVFHWCRGISILPCRFFHHCTRGNPIKGIFWVQMLSSWAWKILACDECM